MPLSQHQVRKLTAYQGQQGRPGAFLFNSKREPLWAAHYCLDTEDLHEYLALIGTIKLGQDHALPAAKNELSLVYWY